MNIQELVKFAPPLPDVVRNTFLECLKLNGDLNDYDPLWNEGNLNRLAFQEARWRIAFANQMMQQLGKNKITEKVKILISIEGGVVQNVSSNVNNIEVKVIDHDCEDEEQEKNNEKIIATKSIEYPYDVY